MLEAAVKTGAKEKCIVPRNSQTWPALPCGRCIITTDWDCCDPNSGRKPATACMACSDFSGLEQIVVLKFLGIPLKQIGALLEPDAKLSGVLQKQREILLARRLQLDKAIRAIGNAQRSIRSKKLPDWKLFQLIIQEFEMQKNVEWKEKYFSTEARAKVAARRNQLSPESLEQANKDWSDLYADVEASLAEDPAGPKGRELADRWEKLVEDFTGGDPEILRGLNDKIADRDNCPQTRAPLRA